MDDLISRKAAIDALDGEITITGKTNAEAVREYVKAVKGRIERIPPVQPKRGRWIDREENMEGMTLMIKRCSECGASKPMKIFSLEDYKFNFCPSCGADMRGGEDAIH